MNVLDKEKITKEEFIRTCNEAESMAKAAALLHLKQTTFKNMRYNLIVITQIKVEFELKRKFHQHDIQQKIFFLVNILNIKAVN